MLFGFPLLSLIIWLPIIAGLIVFVMSDRNLRAVRWVALVGSVAGFLVTLPLYSGFDTSVASMQFVEQSVWFERLNVYYYLGVDGISMPLIVLNSFMTPLVVIAGWEVIREKVSQYMGAFLIMSGVLNGVLRRWMPYCFILSGKRRWFQCLLLLESGEGPTESMPL